MLIVSDKAPRERWQLGLVYEVDFSPDGPVRSCVVKTNGGLVTRNVRKLCLLEGVDNEYLKANNTEK